MIEFKVVRASHKYNNLANSVDAFAIVASTHMVAEPDAVHGVHLGNESDMFIIANNIQEASDMLNICLTEMYGRK